MNCLTQCLIEGRKERIKGISIEVKLGINAFNIFVGNTEAVCCFLQITVLHANEPEKTSSQADSFITRSLKSLMEKSL